MNKNTSLKSSIYNQILEGIFTDEYKPNQILNEKELVERYGCSKSPVREALIALCNEGVLKNIPRYGYEVIRLTRENVTDVLSYRLILEGGMLRTCYDKITDRQIQVLQELDSHCNQAGDGIWDHWDYNTRFHLQLISFANNNYAFRELERAMNLLKRAYAQFYWNRWDNSLTPSDMKSHHHIIKSIQNRRIDDAVDALKADLADFGF